MLSGGELIIVAMAIIALAVLAISAVSGIVTRLLRGDVTTSRRVRRASRTRTKR